MDIIANSQNSLQNQFSQLRNQLANEIIGQEKLLDSLLISLLANGHLLVEGTPGLAKTKSIKTLSDHLEGSFKRIQFTPDLLPSDITGTDIYRPDKYQFEFSSGPLFNNLILADEINRAPAKVQSALLEAMAEQQVSIGNHSYPLSSFFLVMATQNSIEQEGTYPLPEAQLDRFLLQINLDYPNSQEEKKILSLMRQQWAQEHHKKETVPNKIPLERIFEARTAVSQIHIEPQLEEYIVQIIMATRYPSKYNKKLAEWISYGSSPRGSINLEKTAKAHAWLNNRDYVTPHDIQIMAKDVLPHRIGLSFTAQAEQINNRFIINKLLEYIAVP